MLVIHVKMEFSKSVHPMLHVHMLSCIGHVQLFVTPRTVVHQAPLSIGFSRQEYLNELPRPPPGDLPDPGMETVSLTSPALVGRFLATSTTEASPLRSASICIITHTSPFGQLPNKEAMFLGFQLVDGRW